MTLQAELRTAIIAAIHEYAIACTIYNANEFKFVTIATDQILATVSKHLPEKIQTSHTKDLEAVAHYKGYNTAITEMEKTLGADHE